MLCPEQSAFIEYTTVPSSNLAPTRPVNLKAKMRLKHKMLAYPPASQGWHDDRMQSQGKSHIQLCKAGKSRSPQFGCIDPYTVHNAKAWQLCLSSCLRDVISALYVLCTIAVALLNLAQQVISRLCLDSLGCGHNHIDRALKDICCPLGALQCHNLQAYRSWL